MKKLLMILTAIFMCCTNAEASLIEVDSNVAVMDFEPHEGTSSANLDLINTERTSNNYVTEKLVESNKFNVIEKEMFEDQLEDINTLGIISPEDAKKIGKILGVKYIVYGNVTDITVATDKIGVKINRVRAHLIIRLMDVETGRIVMAARGEGQSESSFAGSAEGAVTIGTVQVSQESVHNALQKASYQAADILIDRLFNDKKGRKK